MANQTDRIKFLEELFEDSNQFCMTHNMSLAASQAEFAERFNLKYWTDKIVEMSRAAELGRTQYWKWACTWAAMQVDGEIPSIELYRWACFQGSTFMGMAA